MSSLALFHLARPVGDLAAARRHVRFAGQVGEPATVFIHDPAGNALEFEAFRGRSQRFAN